MVLLPIIRLYAINVNLATIWKAINSVTKFLRQFPIVITEIIITQILVALIVKMVTFSPQLLNVIRFLKQTLIVLKELQQITTLHALVALRDFI